ncbi:Uncharacterized protein conserved in bacteria [Bordetella ansorpii]|uniref:Uncharacterized protein conserved in bacteria n=1 Tax=Bordetella ansorpii TaxID=288768 RepID=A0A157SMV7_9BORD|nr:hypothetical protein [Bordetella ansorpii]SAI71767.1 Uncharacterized protein conserved in bacteria [Bordetella ansorpii]
MLIVIPGALPPASVAPELAKRLPKQAPALHAWLQAGQARSEPFDVRAQGCTPLEAWQLERAGFRGQPELPFGAGLGPLLAAQARTDATRPPASPPGPDAASADASATPSPAGAASANSGIWLADLVHMALGTDQASLLEPDQMDLRPEEGQALYDAVAPLFDGTAFAAAPLAPHRWRVTLPEGLRPHTGSPRAVAGHNLNAWWPQDATMRPWRRLLNEIQMAWYEHPVNEARAARGAAPVNGLWLYGGATPWPIQQPAPDDAQLITDLDAAHRAGDWATWLDALSGLDRARIAPLAGSEKSPLPAQPTELLLLGEDRRVRLTLKPRTGLLKWLPAPKHDWNTWWSRPV